jgi:hypothetical protein
MVHRLSAALLLTAWALLSGCASSEHGRDIDDPANSLVFGHIDMSEAPTSVDYAWIMQVAPPAEKPYWGTGIKDGLFYSSYLPPGTYQLSSFGGSGFFRGEHRYSFPKQGRNETAVRIDKPGIYYLGSYKYKKVKTGMFEQGKFTIERVKTPTETELLQRILNENADIKKSKWGDKIRARLARGKP